MISSRGLASEWATCGNLNLLASRMNGGGRAAGTGTPQLNEVTVDARALLCKHSKSIPSTLAALGSCDEQPY